MNADGSGDMEGDLDVNEDDMVEVIELTDEAQPEAMLVEMAEMGLEGSDTQTELADTADDSRLVFSKHTGAVFCVRIDPKERRLVASGGEDDVAYLWDVDTGEVRLRCSGHVDSVTCVAFSADASYLATADMSGQIRVWDVASRQEVWSFEVGDLEWLEWHQVAPVLLAGTSGGDAWMWMIPSGDCRTFQGHGVACGVGRLFPDGKRLCLGYDDGAVKVWELKGGTVQCSTSGHLAHTAAVTSLDCHPDDNLVLSGSTDVTAKLFSTTTSKVLHTFACGSGKDDDKNSVETVGFSKVDKTVATGTLAGDLDIWDGTTQVIRHKCRHDAGVVKLLWDPSAPLVYTCTLDGAVHLWDGRSGGRERTWLGHSEAILDLQLARDSSMLVSASEDHTVRVFSLQASDG